MPYKFRQPVQLGALPPAATPTIHSALPRLEAVDARMGEHDDTPEGEAVLNASRALALCAKFCRETLGTSARRLFSNYRPEIEGSAKMVESDVPKVGYGTFDDREREVARRISDTEVRFAEEAWKRAVDDQQDMVTRLGTSAKNAMLMAKRAIESGFAKHRGPMSFRGSAFSLDDAAKVGEAREESRNLPPSRLNAMLESLVASGDVEEEMLFTMAIKPVLAEVAGLPYSKLKERIGAGVYVGGIAITGAQPDSEERRKALESERRWATKTLERIEQRADELTPQSLRDARESYAELVAVYSVLLGWNAMVINADDYQLRYRSGRQTDVLDVHPGWPVRLGIALSAGAR